MVDYIRIAPTLENRVAEFVSHLHEHFEHPAQVRRGHYLVPTAPGYGITMKRASLDAYQFPGGRVWRERASRAALASR
jgi:L-fuconate dehydratase